MNKVAPYRDLAMLESMFAEISPKGMLGLSVNEAIAIIDGCVERAKAQFWPDKTKTAESIELSLREEKKRLYETH